MTSKIISGDPSMSAGMRYIQGGSMDFQKIFNKERIKKPGASLSEIESFINSWNADLSKEEIDEINSAQKNPFRKGDKYYDLYKPFDPKLWNFPKMELPSDYIEFLKYSNGGEFINGNRYLQFFSTHDFREMNIAYELPEYMEYAISFAMDGCGNHLLFDMRASCKNNEYPILAAHSGNLGYEDAKLVAASFNELCKGTTQIDDIMSEDDEQKVYPQECDVYLIKGPRSGKSGLLKIKQMLNLNVSMGDLFKESKELPYRLLESVLFSKYYQRCMEINLDEDCLQIVEIQSGKVVDLGQWR